MSICGGISATSCGCRALSLSRLAVIFAELVAERGDAVQRVEHRPQRRARRDVEAVRLPVEVVAQRPEEVVEVGEVVAHLVDGRHGVVERLDLLVGGGGALLLQLELLLQDGDRLAGLVDLLEDVLGPGLLVAQVHDLAGALGADLKRYGAVRDRRAQRPGDRLHQRDARGVQHGLGDAFEDQHVRRVAHVVIGLDHQQFGVQPGLGEVPLGRGIADVGGCGVGQVRAGRRS